MTSPLFQVRVSVPVAASPADVYDVVSDLPRSGEWSSECRGGEWIHGTPATVGAVFRGTNYRTADVVEWAPVVRGEWQTEAEVIAAEPGQRFSWSMRNSKGHKQDSVWTFEVTHAEHGSVLTHHFRMGDPTEGIQGITADMDDADKQRFFSEWGKKLEGEMAATLDRVKSVIEG
jgi:Polyketide cyclase / dehydrase and lipid transport